MRLSTVEDESHMELEVFGRAGLDTRLAVGQIAADAGCNALTVRLVRQQCFTG